MAQHTPVFPDGDVEIWLTADEKKDKLVLHSYVLALHSSWFKASLSDRWSTSGKTQALAGGDGGGGDQPPSRWIYELRFDKGSADGFLLRQGAVTKADFLPHWNGSTDGKLTSSKSRPEPVSLKYHRDGNILAHKELLRAIYHLPPTFTATQDQFPATTWTSIIALSNVARFYDCSHVVQVHFDSHLRIHRPAILDLCISAPSDVYTPCEMLALGVKTQTAWVFQEAATNLLGRSKTIFDAALPTLEELGIEELMTRKRKEFVAELVGCESELKALVPAVEKSSMSTDRWAEQSASFYYHRWLGDRKGRGLGSSLESGYARLYHRLADKTRHSETNRSEILLIGSGYPQHLQQTKLKRNASRENAATLCDEVDGLFKKAGEVVKRRGLLKDVTRRKDKRVDKYRSLRFMEVKAEELPWVGRR